MHPWILRKVEQKWRAANVGKEMERRNWNFSVISSERMAICPDVAGAAKWQKSSPSAGQALRDWVPPGRGNPKKMEKWVRPGPSFAGYFNLGRSYLLSHGYQCKTMFLFPWKDGKRKKKAVDKFWQVCKREQLGFSHIFVCDGKWRNHFGKDTGTFLAS